MNNTGPDSSPVIQSTPKDPVGLVVYMPHDGLCITTDMSVNHRQSASPGSRRPFRIATALPLNSLHRPIPPSMGARCRKPRAFRTQVSARRFPAICHRGRGAKCWLRSLKVADQSPPSSGLGRWIKSLSLRNDRVEVPVAPEEGSLITNGLSNLYVLGPSYGRRLDILR